MNEPPLRHYLSVLRRQAWLIILCTGVSLAVATLATLSTKPVYRASMVIGPGGGIFQPDFAGNVEPFTLTLSNLVRANIVAETVTRNLGLEDSPQELLDDVRVQSKPASAALEISYDSTDKRKAVRVLSEIGRVFTQLVNEKLGATEPPAGGESASRQISAVVFDPAHLEPGQVSPRLSRNLAFAGALGLALGIVLAFVREALDDRIRRRKDAAEWFGAPLIGTLPPGQLRKPIVASLSGRHSRDRLEALQLLRAKLQVATSGVRRPVIVVTSGQQGEGKSFVVASIGLSLALAGKDVICVDADLYRPETHEYLGLPGDRPGFGDLLDHRAELDDVVQYVSLRPVEQGRGTKRPGGSPGASEAGSDSGDDLLGGPSSTWGSLRAVTAGRQDTNSAPFDERRLAELLEELRSSADYVVFDTPPVLLAGDAFPLLAAADSIVVAARKGWTRKGAAEAVRTTLSGLEFDRVSVILTDSDEREAFGYGGRYYNGRPVRSLHEGSGLERHRIPSE